MTVTLLGDDSRDYSDIGDSFALCWAETLTAELRRGPCSFDPGRRDGQGAGCARAAGVRPAVAG